MDGKTSGEAAKVACVDLAAAKSLTKKASVRRRLHEMRQGRIVTELANKAVRALDELLGQGNPPAVRLNAVKLTLELAGHVAPADAGVSKTMDQMSEEELRAFIGDISGELKARHKAIAQGSAD